MEIDVKSFRVFNVRISIYVRWSSYTYFLLRTSKQGQIQQEFNVNLTIAFNNVKLYVSKTYANVKAQKALK